MEILLALSKVQPLLQTAYHRKIKFAENNLYNTDLPQYNYNLSEAWYKYLESLINKGLLPVNNTISSLLR